MRRSTKPSTTLDKFQKESIISVVPQPITIERYDLLMAQVNIE